MMLPMDEMTSQAGQVSFGDLTSTFSENASEWRLDVPDLENVPDADLSMVEARLTESDRSRLTEFWSRVIAEAGADLPGRRETPTRPARRARRVQRQRTVRLIRVLPSTHRYVGGSAGVAA